MLWLYTVLVIALWPLVFLGFVWRYGLRRTLGSLPERFGSYGGTPGTAVDIWFHAASVGEVRAVEPLLKALRARRPGRRWGLTTTTAAGRDLARALTIADETLLAPLDLPFGVNRLLDRWRPRALVLIETELWPNWIATASARGVRVLLLNGRLSDRAFGRYRLVRGLFRPLLNRFRALGAQSPGHAERFRALGADAGRVRVTGNLKYDAPMPDVARRGDLFRRFAFAPADRVWVCGSVHPGEDEVLLDVFVALLERDKGLKLLIAPRHPDRAPETAASCARRGLPYRLRSAARGGDAAAEPPALSASLRGQGALSGNADAPAVTVFDTVGELSDAYGVAGWAFVGGSLVPRGGQNPLEPARWGVPVLCGPHMENFREIAADFGTRNALTRVADGGTLRSAMERFLADADFSRRAGEAARSAAESQRGAVEKALALLEEVGRG